MAISAPSRRLGIVGAGFLGRAIARAFPGPVVAANRSGTWPDPPPEHVDPIAFDLTAPSPPSGWLAWLENCTHIVFCVAPGRVQSRRDVYVDGPRRLMAQLVAPRLRRVVWVGSTSAIGDVDGWVFEADAPTPRTERGRTQREAEVTLQRACEARGVPLWILRLGGLYGPGRDLGAVYRRRSDAPLPGDGQVPTNLVHRDDAVSAVLAALQAPSADGGIVHVVDDDHTPRRAMYDALAAQRGWAPLVWEQPRPSHSAPRGKRVANGRLKRWLGVRLRHPTHAEPRDVRSPCARPSDG